MEELDFWIDICKQIGIPSSSFEKIKALAIQNYQKIQENLTKVQKSLLSKPLVEDDIKNFEIHLGHLASSLKEQESIIMVFALKKFIKALEAKSIRKIPKVKALIISGLCCKVITKLENNDNLRVKDIVEMAISKIEQSKFFLLKKVTRYEVMC